MRVKIRALNGYAYKSLIEDLRKNNEVIYVESPDRLFVSAELTSGQIAYLKRDFQISEDEQFESD